MISNRDLAFKEYYIRSIRPELTPIEEERLNYIKITEGKAEETLFKYIALFILTVGSVIASLALEIPFAIVLLPGSIIAYISISRKQKQNESSELKSFRKNYKKIVLKIVSEYLMTNVRVLPEEYIESKTINDSGLFGSNISSNKGEDYIEGYLNNYKIQFSQNDIYCFGGIFWGAFAIAELPIHFNGETYIYEDNWEKYIGDVAKNVQKLKHGEKLVNLENITFEKCFKVISTDQVEARYILSPRFMESVLSYKKHLKSSVSLSFKSNKIFIALPLKKDIFEPNARKPIRSFTQMCEHLDFILHITRFVTDLDLENRIWANK